uniref:TBC1 domain family member 15-like isoform X2 n=1 Tax=Myxine glutinosa TaxID=7769 RepID=UPI00358E9B44
MPEPHSDLWEPEGSTRRPSRLFSTLMVVWSTSPSSGSSSFEVCVLITSESGINPELRSEAWRFLYGVHPCSSTARERSALQLEQRITYQALKQKWHSMLPEYAKMCTRNVDDTLAAALQNSNTEVRSESGTVVDSQTDVALVQQLVFLKIQATVGADRQNIDIEQLLKAIRIIDKDIPRTRRDLQYYQKDGVTNLILLRNILITFAAFHQDVGYAQGMNDLLSRFLEVLDSEEGAYWCFCAYMARISYNFTGDGMLHKIELLLDLLDQLDHELFAHLSEEELGRMTFCHRWLLLSFQREFPHDEAIRLFEILSSHHLELTSLAAQRVRDETRSSGIQHQGSTCLELPVANPDYTFDLFICAAILLQHKDTLLGCSDIVALVTFSNSLQRTLELNSILHRAEELFYKYCRQSVLDCFIKCQPESNNSQHPLVRKFSELFNAP